MRRCGRPERTYSMMDEYSDQDEVDGCYVNPFVGEGNYARYLRNWLKCALVPISARSRLDLGGCARTIR